MLRSDKKLLQAFKNWLTENLDPPPPPEKRVKTPYFHFCSERRGLIQTELEEQRKDGDEAKIRSAMVTKRLAEIWNKMPDAAKAPYVKLTEDEKTARKAAKQEESKESDVVEASE